MRSRSGWLESKILAGPQTAVLPAIGWTALSKAISLPCVKQPKSIFELAKDFLRGDEITLQGLTSTSELIEGIRCNHPQIQFRDLSTLCCFALALGRDDLSEGPRCIDALTRHLASHGDQAATLRSALTVASSYLHVPYNTSSSHLESFRRRVRVELQAANEISHSRIGQLYLEASELPENQRTIFSQAWNLIASGQEEGPKLVQLVADSLREIRRINEHFENLSASASTSQMIATALVPHFQNVHTVATLLMHPHGGQPLSAADSEFIMAHLARGKPPIELTNLVSFSRTELAPLRDAPEALSIAPLELQQILRQKWELPRTQKNDTEKLSTRSPLEIVRVAELLSPLLKSGEDDIKTLSCFVQLYDTANVPAELWNTELAARFSRRRAKKSSAAVDHRDVREFRLALELYPRLLQAEHTPADALQIAWAYASDSRHRTKELKPLTRALFERAPIESFTRAVHQLARDKRCTDKDFQRVLNFAAKALPAEWGTIRVLFSSWTLGDIVPQSVVRETIASSSHVNPALLRMQVARTVEAAFSRQARKHLLDLLEVPGPEEKLKAQAKAHAGDEINAIYRTDTGPYPLYTKDGSIHPEYHRMMEQVKGIYRGCLDIHYGFGSSTFECRTPPGYHDWMLVRFGLDTGARVSPLRAPASEAYASPGCIISGINLDRIFAKSAAQPSDPYHTFKNNWRWLANEFEDLGDTRFLFSRGVKALIGPDLPKYYLDNCHYSFVVWNDHFLNPTLDVAALVPTSILTAALNEHYVHVSVAAEHPALGEKSVLPSHSLSAAALADACAVHGLHFLNLGWLSNLGGLQNAYPPLSSPYFEVERNLLGHHNDKAGHVHKSHISGRNVTKIDPQTEQLLIPLRALHGRVYALSSAYLNGYDLFRLAQAIWHKGLSSSEEIRGVSQPAFTSNNNTSLGPYELRMLHEAYHWNDLHSRGVTAPEDFPILCITPTLADSSKVASPLSLDTLDLSLKIDGHKPIQLDARTRGRGAYEATVWSKYVRPLYFQRYDLDLRFLDRRSITP